MDLYITDLDGTLLTPYTILTEYSRQVLNQLIDACIGFSIATVRSPSTFNICCKVSTCLFLSC